MACGDMGEDIEKLSLLATQGEWHPGCLADAGSSCNCRSILSDQLLGCVLTCPPKIDPDDKFVDEYPSDAESGYNMRFVCALVNMYRAGKLVVA